MNKPISNEHYSRLWGLRFGALFSLIVSFAWIGILSQSLNESWQFRIMPAITIGIVLVLAWWIVSLLKQKLPRGMKLTQLASQKFWITFGAVIGLEVGVLYAAIQWFNSLGYPTAMWPLIVSVVALHWVPLGKVNGVPEWRWVAATLCAVALVLAAGWKHDAFVESIGPIANVWALGSALAMCVVMVISGFWFQWLYSKEWQLWAGSKQDRADDSNGRK
jgi:hypothetical protein